MGFWSWLTGHDEKESDVYANYDRVDDVVNEINEIATTKVGDAQMAVAQALNELNGVPGFNDYVVTIDIAQFDPVFESLSESIKQIGEQLVQKAENIKEYEESSIFEKIGSTAAMALFKAGEGVLSVGEDLGDAVVSVVGFGAGVLGADGLQEDCANFVKKEWSHDVFNFYYNSDFAKASMITEDSGAAGAIKILGKAAGYLYAGGVIAGQTGLAGATNVGKGILKASGSTWGATIASGVGGFGAGAESGLNQGLSYNEAMLSGAGSAVTSAAFAFLGGKFSETMQARSALKLAQNEAATKLASGVVNSTDDVANAASKAASGILNSTDDAASAVINSVDDAASAVVNSADDAASAVINSADDAASAVVNSADDAASAVANSADDAASGAKEVLKTEKVTFRKAFQESSNYQGYNDAITKAGERFGAAQRNTITSGIDVLKARTGLKSGDPQMKMDYNLAKENFGNSVRELAKENPVSQLYNATVKKAVSGTQQFAANVAQNGVKQTVTDGLKSAATSLKPSGIVNTAREGLRAFGSTAAKVVTNPTTYSVGATAIASALNEKTQHTGITIKDMAENDPSIGVRTTVTGERPIDVAREKYTNGSSGLPGLMNRQQGETQLGGSDPSQYERTDPHLEDPDITTPSPQNTTSGGGNNPSTVPAEQLNTTNPPSSISTPSTTQTPTSNPGSTSTPNYVNPEQINTNPTGNTNTTSKPNQVTTDPIKKSDPVTTNPIKKPDPVTTDPIKKSDPVTTNPIKKPDPVTVEPIKKSDPVTTNPIKKPDPITVDPIKKSDPVTIDPIKKVTSDIKTDTPKVGAQLLGNTKAGLHSGGGYGDDGYESSALEETDKLSSLDEIVKGSSSIDEIIKNSKYGKLPSSLKPKSAKSSGTSSVIPVAAGLSLAAAAGIGAKAYIDHKNGDEFEDEEFVDEEFGEDDDFETEEWEPDIDELEEGTADPNAAGFEYNNAATTINYNDLVEA